MAARTPKDLIKEPVVQELDTTPVPAETFEKQTYRNNADVTVKDRVRRGLKQVYDAEERISVMIAPHYRPHFGKTMHVKINGISVAIPCDGKPHSVPETYAAVVQERLRAINERMEKQARCSDITKNYESTPGALSLN